MRFELTADELAGDLPPVCARTGAPAMPTPVWFASARWWVWLPLGGLVGVSVARGSWAPLASWWGAVAIVAPLLLSRGVTGRVPLSDERRLRISALRRRRMVVTMGALGLTWLAVGLHLLGSRGAALIVLAAIVAAYVTAVAMTVTARGLGVRGRPTAAGGVALRDAHPDFIDAVVAQRDGAQG